MFEAAEASSGSPREQGEGHHEGQNVACHALCCDTYTVQCAMSIVCPLGISDGSVPDGADVAGGYVSATRERADQI